MTDVIVLALSIFFLIRGASRGFINSLLIPFSIIIATIISVVYFQITKDVILCLIIGLLGPILLNILFKFMLKHFSTSYLEVRPGFISRMGGAILTLVWGWVFIVFALILIAVLPAWGGTLAAVHDDVVKSASYAMVKPMGEGIFAATKQNISPSAGGAESNNDTKSLAEDPRFQEALKDPEVQKAIDAHDIVKLVGNPKMMELTRQIMSDPETMKKVLAVYSKQPNPKSYFTNSENTK